MKWEANNEYAVEKAQVYSNKSLSKSWHNLTCQHQCQRLFAVNLPFPVSETLHALSNWCE